MYTYNHSSRGDEMVTIGTEDQLELQNETVWTNIDNN